MRRVWRIGLRDASSLAWLDRKHMEMVSTGASNAQPGRAALRQLQLRKIQTLIDAAWAESQFYSDHWTTAGAVRRHIGTLEEFAEYIPLVRKAHFLADQIATPPFGKRATRVLANEEPLIVFSTSGTSGQGIEVHLQTRNEFNAVQEIYNSMFRWAGLRPGDRAFICSPVSLLAGGQLDLYGLQGYGCTVFPVGIYSVRRKLELIDLFKPRAIAATPSYLLHLAASSTEPVASSSIELLLCSGEGASYSTYERLERIWDARVLNYYGATQFRADPMFTCENFIGSREHPGLLHNLDTHFLLEVIDPVSGKHVRDGEEGEIVLSSLIHAAVPLIRCATGDRGIYRTAHFCRCGRPFDGVELGSIGRLDKMRKIKGVSVWPEAVENMVFAFTQVEDFRVVVSRDAAGADLVTLELLFRKDNSLMASQMDDVMRRLGQELKDRIGITFQINALADPSFVDESVKLDRWKDTRRD